MGRVQLQNVYKVYPGGVTALDGVSLDVPSGTITALLGRSGCGKTTLLNLAGAMDFPSSGDVLIDGAATGGMTEAQLTALRRKRIGFVFQFFQLLPTLTVLENVELPLLLAGSARTRELALDRLEWVELADKASSMPHQLSGGQMQRVAIARALVHSPEILIADEPTGNLDSSAGEQVLSLIRHSAERFGVAVLMATHSPEAAAIAQVRVRMHDGRIAEVERS